MISLNLVNQVLTALKRFSNIEPGTLNVEHALLFEPLQAFQAESDGRYDSGQGQAEHGEQRWGNDP